LIDEERSWLRTGQGILEQLDAENNRTAYVVPTATFAEQLTLHLGGKEVQFLHLGSAHTAGDLIMWLPQQKIVATGDIVTAPIPLMPSPYTGEYVEVLGRIKALGFKTLVPGHGQVRADNLRVEADEVAGRAGARREGRGREDRLLRRGGPLHTRQRLPQKQVSGLRLGRRARPRGLPGRVRENAGGDLLKWTGANSSWPAGVKYRLARMNEWIELPREDN
jgi:glyoxylase-like metal-dependent hydrolase (beta-lactamase superfamily II)